MLESKNQKLTKNEIQKLFKEGKKRATNFFLIYYNTTNTPTKSSVIISKKTAPSAVERNYCKRIVREIVRKEILPKLKKEVSFVLIIKQNLKNTPFTELSSEIKSIIKYV